MSQKYDIYTCTHACIPSVHHSIHVHCTYLNRECPGGRMNPWIVFKCVLSCSPSLKHWPQTWQQYSFCSGMWVFFMWFCHALRVLPAYLQPLIEHSKVFWPCESKCSLRQCPVLKPFWHTGQWWGVSVVWRNWMWCCNLEGPLQVRSQCGHFRVLICLLTCSRRSLSLAYVRKQIEHEKVELSKLSWRIKWSLNFALLENRLPHLAQAATFSAVWLRQCSSSFDLLFPSNEHPEIIGNENQYTCRHTQCSHYGTSIVPLYLALMANVHVHKFLKHMHYSYLPKLWNYM